MLDAASRRRADRVCYDPRAMIDPQEPGRALGPRDVQRVDTSDDAAFYGVPRLVVHIDQGAIDAVTDHIRRLVPIGSAVLDLMSSYRSHLPTDARYAEVVGLGMNAAELAANDRLTDRVIHDLNRDPALPFPDERFDAAVCTVSVQYLTRPIDVFSEVRRVARPGAPFLVTFSNRCFPTKAIRAWHERDDVEHVELVSGYFRAAEGWSEPRSAAHRPRGGNPLYAVWARRAPSGET